MVALIPCSVICTGSLQGRITTQEDPCSHYGFGSKVNSFKEPLIKYIQRVLALCDFWDLEKVALAKDCIRKNFS